MARESLIRVGLVVCNSKLSRTTLKMFSLWFPVSSTQILKLTIVASGFRVFVRTVLDIQVHKFALFGLNEHFIKFNLRDFLNYIITENLPTV